MVTESTVPIERKFFPIIEEPSCLHIVIASNNDWPIDIPRDDRRFLVLDVAETKRQDDAYFTPLRDELRTGGLAAMLHDLLAHPLNPSALRHPLSTPGKREVMMQSFKPIERWWHETLDKGSLDYTDRSGRIDRLVVLGWPESIEKAVLHENYLAFLEKHRETRTRRSTETELGIFLKKVALIPDQRRLPGTDEPAKSYWTLRLLEECRQLWAHTCGWGSFDDADADHDEPPF